MCASPDFERAPRRSKAGACRGLGDRTVRGSPTRVSTRIQPSLWPDGLILFKTMFEHSVTIFRVWGIPVRLHITLLLFLPYAAFMTSYQFRSIADAAGIAPDSLGAPPLVWGVLLAVGLFVSILLHELAHTAV